MAVEADGSPSDEDWTPAPPNAPAAAATAPEAQPDQGPQPRSDWLKTALQVSRRPGRRRAARTRYSRPGPARTPATPSPTAATESVSRTRRSLNEPWRQRSGSGDRRLNRCAAHHRSVRPFKHSLPTSTYLHISPPVDGNHDGNASRQPRTCRAIGYTA